jgi:phosphate transport system protein
MARESFQEDMGDLQDDVLALGETVAARLRRAVAAIENHDPDLAAYVRDGDAAVNELYLAIESDCIDLLTLQQPVAGDLRFVAASFKIITDLERIGDLATNLGDYTLEAQQSVFPDVDVQSIGTETIDMVETAMDAYADEDAEACYAIADSDDALDAQCERASETVARELIEREDIDSEDEVERLMRDVHRLLLTIRDLERVGDHAVNIAARTLYMVENDDDLLY